MNIKENLSVERKLWQFPPDGRRAKEEFSVFIEHLLRTLSDYLQQQIEKIDETIEESIVDDESFCCCIRSASSFGGPLAVAWEGRMGMEPVGDKGKPWVSASLFLFSHNKRLAVTEQKGSYIELVYEPNDNGKGCWRFLGWEEDIYDEFEGIDEYTGKLAK